MWIFFLLSTFQEKKKNWEWNLPTTMSGRFFFSLFYFIKVIWNLALKSVRLHFVKEISVLFFLSLFKYTSVGDKFFLMDIPNYSNKKMYFVWFPLIMQQHQDNFLPSTQYFVSTIPELFMILIFLFSLMLFILFHSIIILFYSFPFRMKITNGFQSIFREWIPF